MYWLVLLYEALDPHRLNSLRSEKIELLLKPDIKKIRMESARILS